MKQLLSRLKRISILNLLIRKVLKLIFALADKLRSLSQRWEPYGNVSITEQVATFLMAFKSDDFVVRDLYYGIPWEHNKRKV